MLLHAFASEIQIDKRCPGGLLHESMQEDNALSNVDVKQDPHIPIARDRYPQLVQALSHGSRQRHAHWPSELQHHESVTDRATIFPWKSLSQSRTGSAPPSDLKKKADIRLIF